MDWIKLIFALSGHLGLGCVLFNQIHASAFPKKHRKISEKLIVLLTIVPLGLMCGLALYYRSVSVNNFPYWLQLYVHASMLFAIFLIGRLVFRKITVRLPKHITHVRTEKIDIQKQLPESLLAGIKANVMGRIPGNQILQLAIEHYDFCIPDLPADLDGIKICQLSDLHFTGLILPEYFQVVVERANEFNPDFVFVTGDIIDEMRCIDWIESVLSQLVASRGSYYVLGNHDLLINEEETLRRRLKLAGLTPAADGQWHEHRIGDANIHITGNERPWFDQISQLRTLDNRTDLRILLSHSPDQMDWAQRQDIDLMFAGHTHGGQICLPFIGPIIAPSRHGVKYAAGTFKIGKKMIMHVSRGLSGDEPIRILCPPELSLITLRCGTKETAK